MKNYGVGYIGSKNKIATKIINDLPAGEHLYDLFAGGCAISHCSSESGKWKHIHANDINAGIIEVFKKSVNGEIKPYLTKWVTREEFFNTTDPVIKTAWSFGNNNHTYIYSVEKEPIAEKMFKAVSGEDYGPFNEMVGYNTEPLLAQRPDITKRRLLAYKIFAKSCIDKDEDYSLKSIRKYIEKHRDDPKYQFNFMSVENLDTATSFGNGFKLQSMLNLERMERLQTLQSLERLDRVRAPFDINFTVGDYSEVEIEPNSVIYCDPPYLTSQDVFYDKHFDQPKFFKWCRDMSAKGHQVYVSGYNITEPGFEKVGEYSTFSCYNKQSNRNNEVLYKVK